LRDMAASSFVSRIPVGNQVTWQWPRQAAGRRQLAWWRAASEVRIVALSRTTVRRR
jgi:hypothetical protein